MANPFMQAVEELVRQQRDEGAEVWYNKFLAIVDEMIAKEDQNATRMAMRRVRAKLREAWMSR